MVERVMHEGVEQARQAAMASVRNHSQADKWFVLIGSYDDQGQLRVSETTHNIIPVEMERGIDSLCALLEPKLPADAPDEIPPLPVANINPVEEAPKVCCGGGCETAGAIPYTGPAD